MSIIEDIKLQYRIGGIANKIIYWNVGVFLLSIAFFYNFKSLHFEYPDWLALSWNGLTAIKFIWTFLTYSFLHGDIWHLIFNMIMLNFTSRLFLTFFTQKQFLGLYILSAVFAGICFTLLFPIIQIKLPLVGASAAIMAILLAVTTYQPLMEVRLLLIGNVKLYYITGFILLLFILQVSLNKGGHVAHFSGAVLGILYIKLLQNGTDLSKIVTNTINFFVNLVQPTKAATFKKVHVNPKKPAFKRGASYGELAKQSKVVIKDKTQQQIDEILDKISQSGYDSLTAEEKEFLFKAGK